MSRESLPSEPIVRSDGVCVRHSRDWWREPGEYPCEYVLNLIHAKDQVGTGSADVEQFACPLVLRVLAERDGFQGNLYTKQFGIPVEVHRTRISPIGCIMIEDAMPPSLNIHPDAEWL